MTLNNYENPISRTLLHSRTIFSEGYVRKDGLFDIESIIKDSKSYDIPRTDGSYLKKGDPLHEMHIVLTINLDMKIIDISAKTISAPYKICSDANFKIKSLIGETIGPGWKNKINKQVSYHFFSVVEVALTFSGLVTAFAIAARLGAEEEEVMTELELELPLFEVGIWLTGDLVLLPIAPSK